jgi:hypothetical protein
MKAKGLTPGGNEAFPLKERACAYNTLRRKLEAPVRNT